MRKTVNRMFTGELLMRGVVRENGDCNFKNYLSEVSTAEGATSLIGYRVNTETEFPYSS